jgi:CubicO group peptidase (beta-lactamase class C family)
MSQTQGRLTDEGIEAFAATAARHVGEDKVPGLVALVSCGDEIHVEALGSLTVGGPPVRRNSLFRIASTTKPVTAAAVMALVDEGRLELDEPVGRILPELANPRVLERMDGPLDRTVPSVRPVTLRDLLTFTFGFGMCVEMFTAPEPWPVVKATDDLRLNTIGPPDPSVPPDPDTWMAAFATLPLIAQPGARWLYNTGAQVLGVVAARAGEAPFEEVLRTRLFDPLGMRGTAMWTAETDRLATAYLATPDGLEVWDGPDGRWSTPPAMANGAAGLVSTADDLLSFARMLLRRGKPVLRASSVEEMTRDQLIAEQRAPGTDVFLDDRSWGFCQAVHTEGPRAGAFGWDGGFGTSWLVDPRRDLVVIVLTQLLFEGAQTPALHTDLQDAAYRALADD